DYPVHGGRFRDTFSPDELTKLAQYISDIERRAFGLTKLQCQKLVFDFAENNGIAHRFNKEAKIAGQEWLKKFMCNFGFSCRTPESTSVGRLIINTQQIYNVDESGLSTVPTRQPKVISPLGTKRVAKVSSGERGKNVTIVCGMSSSGNYIPPFFIFPRKRMRPEFMTGSPPGSQGIAHECGWMTNDNFILYLNHFVKYAKPSVDNPILLILDNHASHRSLESLEAITFCRLNFITMLGFPPHTTHKLQPLDVAFFGPLKSYYNQVCDNFMVSHAGHIITEALIGQLFGEAYSKAATLRTALNGFKACGIEPQSIVLEQVQQYTPVDTRDIIYSTNDTSQNTVFPTVLEQVQQCEATTTNEIDISSLCQPGPSNRDGLTYDEYIPNVQEPVVSQPKTVKLPNLPIATRNPSTRKRDKLPSMILTSSPVKNHLEKKKNLKEELMKAKEQRKLKRLEKTKTKNTKLLKRKTVKKSLFQLPESSEDEEPHYIDTDNEDSAEEDCLYCNEPYKNDIHGEKWIRCIKCVRWAHELCAGVDNYKTYTCEMCAM
ncbi:tigger transposable element-derived protein 6-like, partial [Aphis craccivora]